MQEFLAVAQGQIEFPSTCECHDGARLGREGRGVTAVSIQLQSFVAVGQLVVIDADDARPVSIAGKPINDHRNR